MIRDQRLDGVSSEKSEGMGDVPRGVLEGSTLLNWKAIRGFYGSEKRRSPIWEAALGVGRQPLSMFAHVVLASQG